MASDPAAAQVRLPIGFERLHPKKFINYQLNRAYALGFADRSELRDAAAKVSSADDCVVVFDALSESSAEKGRLRAATSYLRLAEFFTPGGSTQKVSRYRRYRDLFDTGFSGLGITRHAVPYGDGSLPAYRLAAEGPRVATVLVHGGFDSLIEEFVAVWLRLAGAGFEVIAFDGPGQGGARRLGNLTFDHDWEKPVAAILDHFEIGTAGIIGISMGGYWALRAAAKSLESTESCRGHRCTTGCSEYPGSCATPPGGCCVTASSCGGAFA